MEYRSLSDTLMTLRGARGARAAMFELSLDGPVARLTMDRPQARNGLRTEDWRALAALIEQAGRLKARAILVRSLVPGWFCAGIDTGELATLHADPAARLPYRNAMRQALDGIRQSPLPVIAEIDGACVGAGVALAAACDVRLAGPDASFAIPAARQGVGYLIEDIAGLRDLVGGGQAARLLLGAVRIDAAEAARIGLVEQQGSDVARRAADLAQDMAGHAPGALALLKQGLALAAAGRRSDEGHDRACDAALGGAELAESYAAARERRRPDFS